MIEWIAGAAGLAAAGVASYGAIAPESQLFGKTLHRLADPKQLALTFDDGPNDLHTLNLLDVLAKHDVKATFFLIGKHVASKPDIALRIAAAGHVIGNHTDTHPNLAFCNEERIRRELSDCQKILQDTVGEHSKLFRPPFGARRPRVLKVARQMVFTPVMWSVTCYDWKPTTAERVERQAVRQISGGDIILLHDGGHVALGADRAHTVAATDNLITRYASRGYSFVPILSF
jgi:peptidoglycan/xylan/chitin deacetylase (PgdA/CDA1 family)